jgi:predicted alpha/beta hydrolase family esterase
MGIKNLSYWIRDYLYAIHRHNYSFIFRKPPKHYLGYVKENKAPVILIPGLYEKWHFIKAIADPLSLQGHPIYVLEHLGYNTKEIGHVAKLIRELIDEKKLRDVVIVAHSKGGLIGKHLLAFDNQDGKIKKLIAIATPFSGSHIVKFIHHKSAKELHPDSEIIKKLTNEKRIDHKIVSIFGTFDNHIWPESSSYLEGAKNIQVKAYGHHKILSNREVKNIILAEVEQA